MDEQLRILFDCEVCLLIKSLDNRLQISVCIILMPIHSNVRCSSCSNTLWFLKPTIVEK